MQQRRAGRGLRVAAWVLTPLGLVLALGGFWYFFMSYSGVTVSSEAMEPTYRPGDRLVIERIDEDEIRRADVVLVRVPDRYQGSRSCSGSSGWAATMWCPTEIGSR